MTMRRFLRPAAALLVPFTVGAALAGDLNPPAGPVGPTMKTLAQVEPRIAVSAANTPGLGDGFYRITAPGSYYLTGNVAGVAGKSGIIIDAPSVTLDLCGFELNGGTGGDYGLEILANATSCTIRNGTISGWTAAAIYSFSQGGRFEGLTLIGNGASGMHSGGDAQILRCTARLNGANGINAGGGSTVSDCIANDNGTTPSHHGISTADRCLVLRCVANENTGTGIRVNHGGRVIDCQASFNNVGIVTYNSGFVSGALCQYNASDGITLGSSSTVRDSHCNDNADDGIQLADECVALGNHCRGNGQSAAGAGVYAPGDQCRIEDNQLTSNRYGVFVPASGTDNFIVKNTCRNNLGANFSVAAGNDFAPVITNPGTTFSGATPWSNFAY